MKKLIIILLLLIVLLGSGYILMKNGSGAPEFKVLKTVEVKREDLQDVIVETGIVKPQVGAQINVGTQATGKLTKMYVKVGDRVKKGQIIAKVDDREIRATIAQLESSLKKEKEMVAKEKSTYPKRVREAEHERESLKAQYILTELELKRQSDLYEKGFTSRTELDTAETEYQKALAQYNKSRTLIERIEEEHKSEVDIINHETQSISASIEKEKVRLSYTTIYSPLNGIVSDVTAQEGETLVAGLQVAQLITILVPDKLEMWTYVDETEIGRIQIGMPIQFTVDTYSDKSFQGGIDRINPQPVIKDNIVYFVAIVEISKEDAQFLRPEMTTYVKIIVNEKNDVITVANSALKFEKGQQIVYKILPNEKVQKVPIKSGVRGENSTEVLSGLEQGDVVATKLMGKGKKK